MEDPTSQLEPSAKRLKPHYPLTNQHQQPSLHPHVHRHSNYADFDEQELLEMAMEADGPAADGNSRGIHHTMNKTSISRGQARALEDEFDDEELLQMAYETVEDHYKQLKDPAPVMQHTGGQLEAEDIDLADELDQMLAEQEGLSVLGSRPNKSSSSPPVPQPSVAPGEVQPPAPAPRQPDVVDRMIEAVRLRYAPPALQASDMEGTCVTVTDTLGQRVYCRLLPVSALETATADGAGGRRWRWMARGGSLLSRPLPELLRAVEDAQVEAAARESEQAAAEAEKICRQQDAAALAGQSSTSAAATAAAVDDPHAAENRTGVCSTSGSLWVEKYAPRSFLHLLSDDAINREVLKWVKAWDHIVFGSPGQSKSQVPPAASPRIYPEHPAVLICGPPGLGKTTLAHVIADHCGYRPLEINASDDRNSALLVRKVQDAAEMKAYLAGPRPNFVIIDEIDGAMGGGEGSSAVTALVKLLLPKGKQGTEGEGGDAEDASSKNGKKKKKKNKALGRPVICICNDLYTPALRPLREVARIFHFQPPTTEKLVARLTDICRREGVRADRGALAALANKTQCDIRACLNTLQLLSRQNGQRVRLKDVQGSSLGQKDINKTAYSIWTELLYGLPMKGLAAKETQNVKLKRMWEMLENFGEYDMLLNGTLENLLSCRYMDMDFKRTAEMVTQLADADRYLRACWTGVMDLSLQRYVPVCLLKLHLTTTCHERGHLQWPRSHSDCTQKIKVNQEMLHSWWMRMGPQTARWFNTRQAVQDLLPALKHLSCPKIRATAPHLLAPDEHDLLHYLSHTMWAYGVTYSFPTPKQYGYNPEEPEDATTRPCPLKPSLDLMHVYSGLPPSHSPVLSEELRRLVAQQVELETIRRLEEARQRRAAVEDYPEPVRTQRGAHGPPCPDPHHGVEAMEVDPQPATATPSEANHTASGVGSEVPQEEPSAPTDASNKKRTNWLATMRQASKTQAVSSQKRKADPLPPAVTAGAGNKAGAVKRKPPAFAGFGGSGRAGGGVRRVKLQLPVLYKFNEGYTNAVKRPLKMQDLL